MLNRSKLFLGVLALVGLGACHDFLAPRLDQELDVSTDTTTLILPPVKSGAVWYVFMHATVTGNLGISDKCYGFESDIDQPKMVSVRADTLFTKFGFKDGVLATTVYELFVMTTEAQGATWVRFSYRCDSKKKSQFAYLQVEQK